MALSNPKRREQFFCDAHGISDVEYIDVFQFDCFHELIISQELSKIPSRGYGDGIGGGTFIGDVLL